MKRYDYQPGNATRYDLLYGRIEGTQTYALVYLNGGHGASGGSMTFHALDRPTRDDVLGFDAAPVTRGTLPPWLHSSRLTTRAERTNHTQPPA